MKKDILKAHMITTSSPSPDPKIYGISIRLGGKKDDWISEVISTDGTVVLRTFIGTPGLVRMVEKETGMTIHGDCTLYLDKKAREKIGKDVVCEEVPAFLTKTVFDELLKVRKDNPSPMPIFSFSVLDKVRRVYKAMGFTYEAYFPDYWGSPIEITSHQINSEDSLNTLYAMPLKPPYDENNQKVTP